MDIRILIDKALGNAKFIINAGLKQLKAHTINEAVRLLILWHLYESFASFAPIGHPQNIPHMTIKGMFSLKVDFVIFLVIEKSLEKELVHSRSELIIVKGSNVGKIVNNQRLSPLRAYSLVIFILASIKKNIKSIKNDIKFFFIIWRLCSIFI